MLSKSLSMRNGHLGHVNTAKHCNELMGENIQPIHSAPYRIGPMAWELGKAEIGRILLKRVTKPAQTEWAAQIVFASENGGLLRFCVHYENLNAVTERDAYPIPRMDACTDFPGEGAVVSALDVNSGYWQLRMKRLATIIPRLHSIMDCIYTYKCLSD